MTTKCKYILDCIKEAIILCDSEGKIIECNKSTETIFGKTTDAIVNENIYNLIPALKDNNFSSIPYHSFETEVLTNNIPINVYIVTLLIDNIKYLCVVAQNIEHRKNNEKQIIVLNNALRTKVEALKAFQFSVAHDLNAPLRSLEGFSEILIEDYGPQLDENARDYLRRMSISVKRMKQLVVDLVRLSQVTQADTELQIEEFNISEIVNNCIQDHVVNYNENNRKFDLDVEPDIMVYGDKQFMILAVYNLVSNAWKFTSKNELTKIKFGQKQIDDKKIYYITDNGVGFDMSNYERLFKPFSRLHNKTEFDGNGIGLSVVKQIITLHQGEVWAEGQINQGATFYFTIGTKNARTN